MLDRVKKLKSLGILDTPEESFFNEIVKTASLVCEAPISLITLLDEDRQWFKAKCGTDLTETPVSTAICIHTVEETNGYLEIEDLNEDSRFQNDPFVLNDPNLKSYLGVSLKIETGEKIGTVCVLDFKKRKFTEKQINCLSTLARWTSRLIEEKAKAKIVENQLKTLELINKNLENFAYMVAHDIKAPLRNVNNFSNLILNHEFSPKDSNIKEYAGFICQSSDLLGSLVDKLLDYSRQIQISEDEFDFFNLNNLIEEVIYVLDIGKEELQYNVDTNEMMVFASRDILRQVIQNIISNAIKYKDRKKEIQALQIKLDKIDSFYTIEFSDNGLGISKERLDEIFQLFNKDNENRFSTGVGLSVVQGLLNKIGGNIKVESQLFIGTKVVVSIPEK